MMMIFKPKKCSDCLYVKGLEIGTFLENRSSEVTECVEDTILEKMFRFSGFWFFNNRNTENINHQGLIETVPMFRLFFYTTKVKKK